MTPLYSISLMILLFGCTTSQRLKPGKIFGGVEASEGEFPWQVSIQVDYFHLCGGVVLSEDFILTAAHCSQFETSLYRISAGSIDLLQPLSVHHVTDKFVYAGYMVSDFGTSAGDIAIMKVDPPFQLGSRISPASLPKQCAPSPAGLLVNVTGWGVTEDNPEGTDILRKVEIPIVDLEQCNNVYAEVGGVSDGSICAGFQEGGKDSCQGDSGGPLVVGSELRGLVAWGPLNCAQAGWPGVYTEVAHFRAWIRNLTGL